MNSLPETANVVVNHRIAVEDSVQSVKDHYLGLLETWARKRGFQFEGFGLSRGKRNPQATSVIEASSNGDGNSGTLTLSTQYELEPSPVTDAEDVRFEWIVNTLSHVFGSGLVVAPVLLSG